jgi:hypothetical protein
LLQHGSLSCNGISLPVATWACLLQCDFVLLQVYLICSDSTLRGGRQAHFATKQGCIATDKAELQQISLSCCNMDLSVAM